ncbi:MAG: hypothetical protein DME85_14280, partial [Verrucomicrobia bacterium]
ELVRQAFHESFAAAFTGTLRLNLIWPIAIAVLVAITLRSKKTKTGSHLNSESIETHSLPTLARRVP